MKSKPIIRVLILLAVIAAAVVLIILFDVPELFRQFLNWIDRIGIWGPIIYILFYIAITVLFVPGSIPTLGAGAIFGLLWGTIAVSIGSVLGATAAFLVGRFFLRSWVEHKIAGSERFKAVDEAIGQEGGKIIFLLRLSPLFPFNLSNYLYSITKVKLSSYMLGSWIGMLPGTVMYVYIGTLFSSIASIGSEERAREPLEWVLYAVGLVATIAGAIYVTHIARRAIRRHLPKAMTEQEQAAPETTT